MRARININIIVASRHAAAPLQDGDGQNRRVEWLLTCGEVEQGGPGIDDPGIDVHEEDVVAVSESRVDAPESVGGRSRRQGTVQQCKAKQSTRWMSERPAKVSHPAAAARLTNK